MNFPRRSAGDPDDPEPSDSGRPFPDSRVAEEGRRRAQRLRVAVLLGVLCAVGLAYLRVQWLENWTPDWARPQLVSVEILAPANLSEDEEALLEQLEQYTFAGEGVASFTALGDWFLEEQRRYGVARSELTPVPLSRVGPTALRGDPVSPPKAEQSFFERYAQTSRFLEFYQGHRSASAAPNTVYVIFYRRAEHPEFLKIHSVANRRTRSGFVFASLDEDGIETAVINVGHELLHIFGATDKYEGERCAYPTGYVEPFREPRFPQRFAEVMAQGIPLGEGQREGSLHSFGQTRVGVETAYEIGWISKERRARFYAGDRSAGPRLEAE